MQGGSVDKAQRVFTRKQSARVASQERCSRVGVEALVGVTGWAAGLVDAKGLVGCKQDAFDGLGGQGAQRSVQVRRYSDGTQGTRPSCTKRRRGSELRSNKRAQIELSPPCAGSNTSGEDTQSSGGIVFKDELP